MTNKKHIEECVRDSLEGYFKDLRGVEPTAMYEMILRVVERPLFEVVLKEAGGKPEPRCRMAGHQPQHLATQARRAQADQVTAPAEAPQPGSVRCMR